LPYRYSSVRYSHITEEIKKTISTKQAKVKGAITIADRQLVVLENKLEDLNLSSDDDKAARPKDEGRTEALRQLKEELKGVKESQKLLNKLLSKSQEEAVAKAVRNQSVLTTVTFSA
jgi:2,3-bisphosphoglycerate-independent phosphoglycerate mutase